MDIMISIRELEQAPRAVRDWLVGTLARQLALLPAADAPAPASPDLAELSPAAAAVLFEQLRNDYLACQLLLEFGRDNAVHEAEPSRLHRLAVADVLHHLRLGSSERFVAALKRISEAWAAIAPAGQKPLFALDEAGSLYVSKATQSSLRSLWHQLVTDRYSELVEGNPSGPSMLIDGHQRPAHPG